VSSRQEVGRILAASGVQTIEFLPRRGPRRRPAGTGLFAAHSWIFKGMLTRIADAAQGPEESRTSRPGITAGLHRV